jgi:hypothetical protein
VSLPRRRVGFVVLLILGLGLTGCGSADVKPKPATPQGSDPVAWAGAICSGYGGVVAGAAAAAEITKTKPTSQGQKDGVLALSEAVQQSFANTAHKLEQLGPPRITDGKRIQDTAVAVFTTTAGTVASQRAKFAALDANDPNFLEKASHLAGPDVSGATTQLQKLNSNKELATAFVAAPECKQLGSGVGHR